MPIKLTENDLSFEEKEEEGEEFPPA